MGALERSYIATLAETLGWDLFEVWIDSMRGTFVRGVTPCSGAFSYVKMGLDSLPSSVEFFRDEDVLWQYLSLLPLNMNLDRGVVDAFHLSMLSVRYRTNSLFPTQPTTSSFTKSIFVLDHDGWCESTSTSSCIGHKVLMPYGLTRFTVGNGQRFTAYLFSFLSINFNIHAWLSQAWSLLPKHGISLDDDLSDIELIPLDFSLRGYLKHPHKRRKASPLIYLFILPCRHQHGGPEELIVSDLHFWSFDPTGRTRIPKHECQLLGLPTKLRLRKWWDRGQYSWATEAYKKVHRWQVDRGFDPTTTDFARYLEYPIIKCVPPVSRSRFEELDDGFGLDTEDLSLDTFFYNTSATASSAGELSDKTNSVRSLSLIWSALTIPFSWNAGEGSEVPIVVL